VEALWWPQSRLVLSAGNVSLTSLLTSLMEAFRWYYLLKYDEEDVNG
jgi:hypothetical protein